MELRAAVFRLESFPLPKGLRGSRLAGGPGGSAGVRGGEPAPPFSEKAALSGPGRRPRRGRRGAQEVEEKRSQEESASSG